MKRLIVFIALLVVGSFNVHANSPLSASESVWQIMRGLPENTPAEKISQILTNNFDVIRFSELALYKHWPHWTPDQRDAFMRRFLERLTDRIKSNLASEKRKAAGAKFDLTGMSGELAEVSARGMYKKKTIDMEIFLINRGGAWRVYDYNVEGANLIRNYRAQFNKLLRLYGFEGFIAKM